MVDRRKNEDFHIPDAFSHDNVVTKGPWPHRLFVFYRPYKLLGYSVPRTVYVMLRNRSEWSIPIELHSGR